MSSRHQSCEREVKIVLGQNDLTVNRETLVDKIVGIIEKQILSGDLPPKSRLSEAIVAGEFGVSRVPAREALQRLEEMGFVRKTRLGREVVEFSIDEFRDIYELKNVVEAFAIMRGANMATEKDLKELRNILMRMEKTLESSSMRKIRQLNAQFHDRMVGCSQNQTVIEVYQLRAMQVRWASSLSLGFPNRLSLAYKEHMEIFYAFSRKEGEKARVLMEKHTNGSMERIISRLRSNEEREKAYQEGS